MTLRISYFPFAYRYVRANETVLAERKAKDMALRHRIRINVSDEKSKARVLEGADRRLPMRLLRFLFGDFTTVYLLCHPDRVSNRWKFMKSKEMER